MTYEPTSGENQSSTEDINDESMDYLCAIVEEEPAIRRHLSMTKTPIWRMDKHSKITEHVYSSSEVIEFIDSKIGFIQRWWV
jgi:hypothetical protein